MKIIFENNKKVSEYPNGIFETLLVKDGFPIFLEYHFKRFITGLKEYLNISFSESDLINLRKELLDHLEKGDYGCRFVYCENTIYISYRQLENKDVSSLTISRNIRQKCFFKFR